jgi:hypothetical protein
VSIETEMRGWLPIRSNLTRRSFPGLVALTTALSVGVIAAACGAQAATPRKGASSTAAVAMPAGCASWDGAGVVAMFCDPTQLKGIEPIGRAKARVKLSGPGLRDGSAAGVSQASGRPLLVGQTLRVSGATGVSAESVLFVSGQGEAAGPDLWPTPSLTVGFTAGDLARGAGTVTFVQSGRSLAASLRDGHGRVIQPGYVRSVVAPAGGPQTVLAYFFGLIAIEDNPDYNDCTLKVVSGRTIATPASLCNRLQSGVAAIAKLRATIHGNTATITPPGNNQTVQHLRKVADRWYVVVRS